jgi:hypothetical protein
MINQSNSKKIIKPQSSFYSKLDVKKHFNKIFLIEWNFLTLE